MALDQQGGNVKNNILILLVALVLGGMSIAQGYLIDNQQKAIVALEESILATGMATMKFAIDVGTDMRLLQEAVEYLLEEERSSSI